MAAEPVCVKVLARDVRKKLRSGFNICSASQAVEELVLNAVDAAATCIAVRVDLKHYFKIQVVDNGTGIAENDLKVIGTRYATSKCRSKEDLENNLTHYGFRGEALASLSTMSGILEITSKYKDSTRTYCKIFSHGKLLQLAESQSDRPSFGTTVTIHDFMYNFPVRRQNIQDQLELEGIRIRMEAIALMYPNISFTLRNDVTGNKIMQTKTGESVLDSFRHLFGTEVAACMGHAKHELGPFKVDGYIGKEPYHNKALQFVFINKRLVLKTKLHKLVNQILKDSRIMKQKLADNAASRRGSPSKSIRKLGIFVINITCGRHLYDITFEPQKTLVEVIDLEVLMTCVKECMRRFLVKENLDLNYENQETTSKSSGSMKLGAKKSKFQLRQLKKWECKKKTKTRLFGQQIKFDDFPIARISLPVKRQKALGKEILQHFKSPKANAGHSVNEEPDCFNLQEQVESIEKCKNWVEKCSFTNKSLSSVADSTMNNVGDGCARSAESKNLQSVDPFVSHETKQATVIETVDQPRDRLPCRNMERGDFVDVTKRNERMRNADASTPVKGVARGNSTRLKKLVDKPPQKERVPVHNTKIRIQCGLGTPNELSDTLCHLDIPQDEYSQERRKEARKVDASGSNWPNVGRSPIRRNVHEIINTSEDGIWNLNDDKRQCSNSFQSASSRGITTAQGRFNGDSSEAEQNFPSVESSVRATKATEIDENSYAPTFLGFESRCFVKTGNTDALVSGVALKRAEKSVKFFDRIDTTSDTSTGMTQSSSFDESTVSQGRNAPFIDIRPSRFDVPRCKRKPVDDASLMQVSESFNTRSSERVLERQKSASQDFLAKFKFRSRAHSKEIALQKTVYKESQLQQRNRPECEQDYLPHNVNDRDRFVETGCLKGNSYSLRGTPDSVGNLLTVPLKINKLKSTWSVVFSSDNLNHGSVSPTSECHEWTYDGDQSRIKTIVSKKDLNESWLLPEKLRDEEPAQMDCHIDDKFGNIEGADVMDFSTGMPSAIKESDYHADTAATYRKDVVFPQQNISFFLDDMNLQKEFGNAYESPEVVSLSSYQGNQIAVSDVARKSTRNINRFGKTSSQESQIERKGKGIVVRSRYPTETNSKECLWSPAAADDEESVLEGYRPLGHSATANMDLSPQNSMGYNFVLKQTKNPIERNAKIQNTSSMYGDSVLMDHNLSGHNAIENVSSSGSVNKYKFSFSLTESPPIEKNARTKCEVSSPTDEESFLIDCKPSSRAAIADTDISYEYSTGSIDKRKIFEIPSLSDSKAFGDTTISDTEPFPGKINNYNRSFASTSTRKYFVASSPPNDESFLLNHRPSINTTIAKKGPSPPCNTDNWDFNFTRTESPVKKNTKESSSSRDESFLWNYRTSNGEVIGTKDSSPPRFTDIDMFSFASTEKQVKRNKKNISCLQADGSLFVDHRISDRSTVTSGDPPLSGNSSNSSFRFQRSGNPNGRNTCEVLDSTDKENAMMVYGSIAKPDAITPRNSKVYSFHFTPRQRPFGRIKRKNFKISHITEKKKFLMNYSFSPDLASALARLPEHSYKRDHMLRFLLSSPRSSIITEVWRPSSSVFFRTPDTLHDQKSSVLLGADSSPQHRKDVESPTFLCERSTFPAIDDLADQQPVSLKGDRFIFFKKQSKLNGMKSSDVNYSFIGKERTMSDPNTTQLGSASNESLEQISRIYTPSVQQSVILSRQIGHENTLSDISLIVDQDRNSDVVIPTCFRKSELKPLESEINLCTMPCASNLLDNRGTRSIDNFSNKSLLTAPGTEVKVSEKPDRSKMTVSRDFLVRGKDASFSSKLQEKRADLQGEIQFKSPIDYCCPSLNVGENSQSDRNCTVYSVVTDHNECSRIQETIEFDYSPANVNVSRFTPLQSDMQLRLDNQEPVKARFETPSPCKRMLESDDQLAQKAPSCKKTLLIRGDNCTFSHSTLENIDCDERNESESCSWRNDEREMNSNYFSQKIESVPHGILKPASNTSTEEQIMKTTVDGNVLDKLVNEQDKQLRKSCLSSLKPESCLENKTASSEAKRVKISGCSSLAFDHSHKTQSVSSKLKHRLDMFRYTKNTEKYNLATTSKRNVGCLNGLTTTNEEMEHRQAVESSEIKASKKSDASVEISKEEVNVIKESEDQEMACVDDTNGIESDLKPPTDESSRNNASMPYTSLHLDNLIELSSPSKHESSYKTQELPFTFSGLSDIKQSDDNRDCVASTLGLPNTSLEKQNASAGDSSIKTTPVVGGKIGEMEPRLESEESSKKVSDIFEHVCPINSALSPRTCGDNPCDGSQEKSNRVASNRETRSSGECIDGPNRDVVLQIESTIKKDENDAKESKQNASNCIDGPEFDAWALERSFLLPSNISPFKPRRKKNRDISCTNITSEVTEMISEWENPMMNNVCDPLEKSTKTAFRQTHKFSEDIFEDIKVVGQWDRKLIVCTAGSLLLVVDQHAAHERVRLERLQAEYQSEGSLRKTTMRPPLQVTVRPEVSRCMSSRTAAFQRLGLSYSVQRGGCVQITAVPQMLVEKASCEPKAQQEDQLVSFVESLLIDQADLILGCGGAAAAARGPRLVYSMLASLACRGAIKFNDALTVTECEELIRQLSGCKLPFQCAHGRPAILPILDFQQLYSSLPVPKSTQKLKLQKLKPKR